MASLANIVVFFTTISSPEDILNLSDNARFRFTPSKSDDKEARWKAGQTGEFLNTFCFKFGKDIHSPRGWIAGRAPTDNCDLQLATNNETGISRFHFRIDISPMDQPRITNLSGNEMRIHKLQPHGQRSAASVPITLCRDDDVEVIEAQPIDVDLGEVVLRMWRPKLTIQEEAIYTANANAFHEDYLHALPKPTRVPPVPTLDIRFGLGQAAYRKVGNEPPRCGTFGSVIKVMELGSREIYAAKIPHTSHRTSAGEDRKQWEVMSKEYQKLMELQHENIVETIEILPGKRGIEPPWLIMEWVDQSLHSYAPSAGEIPVFLCQLSSGLAYMHNAGFTHRDLKPENILIQRRGTDRIAKIADVGLSKYAGDRNMHTYAGTLLYMAPELWDSKLGYTNAVDMWSFGIVALELLTGWNLKLDGPRNRGAPPSETSHIEWIHKVVLPRRDRVPSYKPLLDSLLSIDSRTRWDAVVCNRWLVNNLSQSQSDKSVVIDDGTRYIRSGHPTLSTTRAKSLPDTASWGGSEG